MAREIRLSRLVTDGPVFPCGHLWQDQAVKKAEILESRQERFLILGQQPCDLGEITSLASFLICLKKEFL